MNDKRWAKKIFKWRGRKSTFRKETDRNMIRIDMKITSNNEDLEIEVNGEKVEGEKEKSKTVKKEVKKEGLKKMESRYRKEKKSLR